MREGEMTFKKMRILLFIFLLASTAQMAQDAPSIHICASDGIHARLMEEDAAYRAQSEVFENRIADAARNPANSARSSAVLTIPLVVHIMHNGESIGTGVNISEAQVQSALVALNEDFRKEPGSNGDGNGVDTEIEFCLASMDPNGNSTNGINRINASSITNYSSEGITAGQGSGANELAIKSLSRWNRDEYYNIWIVSEIEDNDGGSGIQGYAYYPNSSASLDGAVILYNAFGTVGDLKFYTNQNRVTTHELGHGLFLYHTFQGASCTETNCSNEGDRVCDTPATTLNSNCNTPACGGTQQVENYMDYSNQSCLNMFTQGQKTRMRDAIQITRPSLLNSLACSESELACTGDFNGDGLINIEDFVTLNSMYGQTCSACAQDMNGDGLVNIEDFLIFNSLINTSCGPE
jgi:hypothetical protein